MHMKSVLKRFIVLFSLLTSGCSFSLLPNINSGNSEQNLSSSKFEEIIYKAVEEEKNKMSSVSFEAESSENRWINNNMLIKRYNNRYYRYTTGQNSDPYYICAYSTSDYQHNYYGYCDENYNAYDVNEYFSGDNSQDQYIYTFGYGQIGFNPASFIACYSIQLKVFNPQSIIEVTNIKQKGNNLSFTTLNYGKSEGMNMFCDVTLNSSGGITKLVITFENNPTFIGSITANVTYGKRENAPAEIVQLFSNYA